MPSIPRRVIKTPLKTVGSRGKFRVKWKLISGLGRCSSADKCTDNMARSVDPWISATRGHALFTTEGGNCGSRTFPRYKRAAFASSRRFWKRRRGAEIHRAPNEWERDGERSIASRVTDKQLWARQRKRDFSVCAPAVIRASLISLKERPIYCGLTYEHLGFDVAPEGKEKCTMAAKLTCNCR